MVIPVLCLIIIIINFMAGERKLPEELKGTNIYFFIAFIISTGVSLYIYFKSLIKLEIGKIADKVTIEIKDTQLTTPLILSSPFTMSKQWYYRETGQRGVKMKELCLTFIDHKGESIFTIISVLGALYDAPYEWEFLDLFNEVDKNKWKISTNIYTNGKAEEISLEVNSLLAQQ